MHGQGNNLYFRLDSKAATGRFQTPYSWHLYIHQDHIRLQASNQINGLLTTARFTYDTNTRLVLK